MVVWLQVHHQRQRFASVTEEDIHNYLLHLQTGLSSVVEQDEQADSDVSIHHIFRVIILVPFVVKIPGVKTKVKCLKLL